MAAVVLHVGSVGQVMARDVFAARPAAVLAGILAPLALGLATILRSLPHVLAAVLLVLAAVLFVLTDGFAMVLQGLAPRLLVLLRSEEHTSELQSLMRISYAVFCLKTKNTIH